MPLLRRSAPRSGRRNGRTLCAVWGTRIAIRGQREREPQLLEILLIGERKILVEPLGHEHFRRRSPMRVTVRKLDAGAHEYLRRLGECDHAEPKGQAQAHLPFVEAHFSNVECGGCHVSDPLTGQGR